MKLLSNNLIKKNEMFVKGTLRIAYNYTIQMGGLFRRKNVTCVFCTVAFIKFINDFHLKKKEGKRSMCLIQKT